MRRLSLTLLLSLGACCIPAATARAQAGRVGLKRLAVDCLTLEGGPRLLGALVGRDSSGMMTIAVERTWLRTAAPEFCRTHEEREQQQIQAGMTVLPERIRTWIAETGDNERLLHALKDELAKAETALKQNRDGAPAPTAQFLLVRVPANEIRLIYPQPAERRQVALLAWRERLDEVQTRPARDLARELQEKNVAADSIVDLSDRLPRLPDDERQWAARRALFESALGRALEFQGTGDLLVRAGEDAQATGAASLLSGLLKSQLEADLSDLTGVAPKGPAAGKREFDSAKSTAERDGFRGFRVTQLEQDLTTQRVRVDKRFLARMPDGTWETIWRHVEDADATMPRKEYEDRIRKDPRVKQIFSLLETVAGGDADAMSMTALRFAAATMSAQQRANAAFQKFQQRFSEDLSGPPLMWASQQP